MVLAVIAVILGVAAGLAVGREARVGLLGEVRPLDAVALLGGLLLALGARLPLGRAGCTAMAAAGYGLLALEALRLRRHAGLTMISAGLVANVAVILADEGMPVSSMSPGTVSGLHHGLTSADRLPGLADVVAVPLLGLTASAGDLVIGLGAAVAAFAWLTAPGDRASHPSPPDRPAAAR